MSLTTKIKSELDKLGIKPKKSLGQNFLVNPKIYEAISEALEIKRGGSIIEIGPGLGTLTEYLLDAGAKVIAVEKDSRLIGPLKVKFSKNKNAIIKEGDILEFKPREKNAGYLVTGNIPYYIASHIIRTILESWPRPIKIVLMVQKEIAERITAQAPNANLLSITTQYFAGPKLIKTVKKENFWPTPGVDSAVISITPRQTPFDGKMEKLFFTVVRAGFSSKRKQLLNSIQQGLGIEKDDARSLLRESDIEPSRRAETLTLPEWQTITKNYSNFLQQASFLERP